MKRNALNLRDLGGIPLQDGYSRGQLDLVVNHLRKNVAEGKCTR